MYQFLGKEFMHLKTKDLAKTWFYLDSLPRLLFFIPLAHIASSFFLRTRAAGDFTGIAMGEDAEKPQPRDGMLRKAHSGSHRNSQLV